MARLYFVLAVIGVAVPYAAFASWFEYSRVDV